MASQNNIIKLADFPRPKDSAVAALERMQAAGDNDAEYAAAAIALELATPTSDRGIVAKLARVRDTLESLRDGEELTPAGWDVLLFNLCGVLDGLEARIARVA